MRIKQFAVNPLEVNLYIYFDEITKEGILIDPAVFNNSEKEELINFIQKNKIKIKYILNTHGHFDHILGNKFCSDTFCVQSGLNSNDRFLVKNAATQAAMFGLSILEDFSYDFNLDEKFKFKLGENEISILHTPGHSPGSVCIIDNKEKVVFCGDLIFYRSIGKTDLPGGNFDTLLNSITKKLFEVCSDDYTLYPGHMNETTIGDEKRFNPFLQPYF